MKTTETRLQLKEKLKHTFKKKRGYIPVQYLEMFARLGVINSDSLDASQFQPASLDLRLGRKAYRIQSSFLPEKKKVEDKLKDEGLVLYEVDLVSGGILEKGAIYLIPLLEELVLPKDIHGRTNPKSSTGRLDMFTRVIIDHGHRFDEITPGYRGKMYLEVIPRSFPVRVQTGLSLNQLRLIKGDPEIADRMLKTHYNRNPILHTSKGNPLLLEEVKLDGGLFIGVDLVGEGKNSIIAYKAKSNSSVIDLSKIKHYDPMDFWEPIHSQKKNRLILEPESFYIMMSKEKICIWPHLLAEMIAYDPSSGELRTHYAGFFDPGFGWHGENAPRQGTRAVMEVRPHDVPFMVEDGQTVCRLKFEAVVEEPTRVYGKQIHSNYQSQGLTLSKYFKPITDSEI